MSKWRTGVTTTIFSGLLLLVVEYTLFRGKITLGLLGYLEQAWGLLFRGFIIEPWHIIVVLFCILSAYLLYAHLSSSSNEERHVTEEFTAGEIDGLLWSWQWEYANGNLYPAQLGAVCPECGMPIDLEKRYDPPSTGTSKRLAINPGRPTGSQVKCEHPKCGYEKNWDRVPEDQRDFVRKEISRLATTDQWRSKTTHTFTRGIE